MQHDPSNFKLQLGPVSVQTEAAVAEIDDDELLGVDVLQNKRDGPTDLLMSRGMLKMGDKEVPIIKVGITDRTRKVTAADHSIIPAQSEAVIDVYNERREYELLGVDVLQNRQDGPTDLFMSRGMLKMGDKEVPIIQVGITNRTRKVTAADHSIIPAQSEAVIDVYNERREYDDFSSESEYIVEPTEHFQEE